MRETIRRVLKRGSRRTAWKRIIVFDLVIAFLLSTLGINGIYTIYAASESKGRIINVVYDDSGSMVTSGGENIPRWSQAKYALEVFGAMLNENDVMNIYPMSKEGGLGFTLKGASSNRVKTIHDMNGLYANTPFTTVKSAGQNLIEDNNGKEKWLVIITDGAFDDGATPTEEVQSTIDSYNSQGIKVAYLAIGDNAVSLQSNAKQGFYAEKAEDGVDVINKVTSIANQIFEHLVLPDSYIATSGNDTTLTFDIPIEQVVVFAQGDDVSIGDLSINGSKVSPSETQNVKYSDVTPENYQDAVVDDSLKGVVAIYNAGDEPFAEGDYSISVKGAEVVEYYYTPGVIVNASLSYGGSPVSEDAELYSGDYEVNMNFINPLTGETVTSKLLEDAEFSLTVTNNGKEQTIESSSGSIQLTEGDVSLTAVAKLPGQVELSDQKDYVVLPEPIELSLSLDQEKYEVSANDITDKSAVCTLTVINSKTGEKLSSEEWNSTNITVESKSGIEWDVQKGANESTWLLVPYSSDGSIASVGTGDLEFIVSADYQIENQYAHGSNTIIFNVAEYESSPLILEIDSAPSNYTMDNLESESGIVVKAYVANDLGDKEVVSEELWQKLDFKASSEQKIGTKVEKGTEVGTFVVYPQYYKGEPLSTDEGNIKMKFSADGQDGERKYEGSCETTVNVAKMSQAMWLKEMAPRFIALGIILFILFGYIKKNKIKKKKLFPHNSYRGKNSGRRKIVKDFWSVVIPYVNEKAVVRSNNPEFRCDFPNLRIKAISKNGFKILNSLDTKYILINLEKIDDAKEIKKRKFTYAGFQITSVDKKNKNKRLGSFSFK